MKAGKPASTTETQAYANRAMCEALEDKFTF